ncbi:MAG: hypothetical protein PW786_04675 [Arachidicoccus sp.]|nr:hypothetical protein [Arachidicoccus sp.]
MRNVNFATKTYKLRNKTQSLKIIAEETATTLKDITVKTSTFITQKGDTINYNLNAFAAKQDRTLGDVLKKIPGIQVDDNGTVRYQGVPINKFYVEGKDLMQGRYGLITNAMPNTDVDQVQIYQNHQPVKLLQGRIATGQPALNIKLKNGVSVSGRAEIGAGGSPFIWNTKITPMLFSKKYQYLVDYKMNNNGEDLLSDIKSNFLINSYEGEEEQNITGQTLNIAKVSIPSYIKMNKYLFNNTQSFSGNALTNISKNITLNINSNYTHDISKENGMENTTIIGSSSNNGINYSRVSKSKLYTNHFDTKFTLTQNTDNLFFKDDVEFALDNNSTDGNIVINNLPMSQRLNSPGYSFQNSFSGIVPFDKKKIHLLNIKSFINYVNDKQTYVVTPLSGLSFNDTSLATANELAQHFLLKTFSTKNSATVTYTFGKFTLVPTIGADVQSDWLNSILYADNTSNIPHNATDTNRLKYILTIIYAKAGLSYESQKVKANLSLPLKENNLHASDNLNVFNQSLSKPTFEPELYFKYDFANNLSFIQNGSVQYQFSDIKSLYIQPIFNALDFDFSAPRISQTRSINYNSSVAYANPLKSIFATVSYSYNNNKNNLTVSQQVLGNGQQILSTLDSSNVSVSNNINFNFGKYFYKAKTNFSVLYSYYTNKSSLILNNAYTHVLSKTQSYGLKLNNSMISCLSVDYSISLSLTDRNQNEAKSISKSLSQNLSAFFFPNDNNSINFIFNNSDYFYDKNSFKNIFVDAAYQYTLKKRKIDFELKITNILHKTHYKEVDINNIQTNTLFYIIRPRQAIFTVKFNFH